MAGSHYIVDSKTPLKVVLIDNYEVGQNIDECLIEAHERGTNISSVLMHLFYSGEPFTLNPKTGLLAYCTKKGGLIDLDPEKIENKVQKMDYAKALTKVKSLKNRGN